MDKRSHTKARREAKAKLGNALQGGAYLAESNGRMSEVKSLAVTREGLVGLRFCMAAVSLQQTPFTLNHWMGLL